MIKRFNRLAIELPTRLGDPDSTPLAAAKDVRNTQHFIVAGQNALPFDSMGKPWTGENVFNSGNLILDLLHNFFLECGARTHKMRVYEMTSHPVARALIGYLLVGGGVHIVAYAKALEVATGADVTKLIPIPSLDNKAFNETRKYEEKGLHRVLYRFSDEDYKDLEQIWKGAHPEDGGSLIVKEGIPEGGPIPDYADTPEEFAPGIFPEDFMKIAARLQQQARITV